MQRSCTIVVLLVARVAGATPYESGGKVDEYYGAYTEHVDIVVPPFHGLEPHLAVDYNSGRGNGMLGVGWALHGLSVIEKVDGSHTPDGAVYELDGQLLIPCDEQTDRLSTGAARSPSCSPDAVLATSGNARFSTLQETYLRIEHGTIPGEINDVFVVWEPNGTKRVYRKPNTTPTSASVLTQKWVLTSATDTDGNTVTYDWLGTADGVAFDAPKSITYNGTVIAFYYSNRVPLETFANHGNLETMDRVLTTIDVCVNAGPNGATACSTGGTQDPRRARTYVLSYRPSGATSRPLLTTMTMYGKNAVINGTSVTSGDHFPAMVFGWSDQAPAYTLAQVGPVSNWGSEWLRGMVDFNGDGRTDFCRDDGNQLVCAMSTGGGLNDIAIATINDWGEDKSGAWVDWDGDGKADFCRLVCRSDSGGSCGLTGGQHHFLMCAISTGTAVTDLTIGGEITDPGAQGSRWFVDWNGDGKTDFCRAFTDTSRMDDYKHEMKCAFSMGTAGYDDKVVSAFRMDTWMTSLSDVLGVAETRAMVDWNGDGRADFCRVVQTQTANEVRCMIGVVDDFAPTRHLDGTGSDYRDITVGTVADIGDLDSQWWVDVNGDGKSDCCRMTGTVITCAISLQNKLVDQVWDNLSTQAMGNTTGGAKNRRFGDINGDGKADFCRDVNGQKLCDVSLGMTAAGTVNTGITIGSLYEKHWIVDWDGDGYPEYCMNTGSNGGSGSYLSCMRRNPFQIEDVATSFSNGIGGTTTVQYVMSSIFGQTRPDFPVVNTVTRTGGAEGPLTQYFYYAQGQYDAFARRFLGFGWVGVVDPCLPGESLCPLTATTYRLDPRWPTKPSTIARYGASRSQPLEMKEYFYVDSTDSPYRSELRDEYTSIYDNADYVRSEREWAYDDCGNATLEEDLGAIADTTGQTSLTGDETEVDVVFEPNLASYVIDKPAEITTTGATGTQLADIHYIYDGASSWTVPPTLGHATQTLTWVDNPNHVITASATYDAYGNLTTETDGLGNTTSTTSDWTYHQYITKVTQPTQQSESTAIADWDVQCGVRKKVTQDQNGTSTISTYDNLCRKVRDDLPGGGWEKIAYNDALMGTPGQYTEVTGPGAPLARGSSDLWARTYFDGWGRATKKTRRGPTAGVEIVDADFAFNARGKLAWMTRPHYANDVAYAYSYGYDLADRRTSEALPAGGGQPGDGKAYAYGHLSTTTSDAMGFQHVDQYDVHARRHVSCTLVGSMCTDDTTLYGYDERGNVAVIQQQINHGSQWAFWTNTYDSLGHKIASTSPDAGNRSYVYDDGGNLSDEYDGRGARVHYTYDAVHRRTSKSWGYCVPTRFQPCFGTQPAYTVTWTYDEPRAGYYNVGKLTSMTDASGTATYNYDAAGNLVQGGRTVSGTPYVFTKQYDLGGRLLATTYPDGSTVGTASDPLGYDEGGRLDYIPGFVNYASYDAAGTLTYYIAGNGSTTTFNTANPRGDIAAYKTTGRSTFGPVVVLGDFATSRLGTETFTLSPNLSAGQTIIISTCGSSVPGATGTGDTYLHLRNGQNVEVASSDNAGGSCGTLSTIRYTIPSGGDGQYTVIAGCAGLGSCTGTVAARLESLATNLALGKPVTMSSVYDPTCGPPSAATDGVTGGTWCTRFSMAHSRYESRPYLYIDLGSTQQVDHVNIWNRSDSLCDALCLQRLSNFDVSIWNGSAWVGMANVPDQAGWPTRVDLGTTTRYVMIQLRGTNYLNTPEVEVFAPSLTAPALVASPLVHDVTVQRDAGGRISEIRSNRVRESWTFTYDPNAKGELATATNTSDATLSRTYGYDAGNLTANQTGTLSYGGTAGPHALASVPDYTFSYDNAGETTAATNTSYAPLSYTYTWNTAGQLTSANGVSYTYDADGYRLAKTFNGATTIYLGDDYEVGNGVATKYVSLGGRLVARQQGSASPTWLYTDVRGSVVFGLDGQSTRVFTTSYGPYGEILAGGIANARGYTGQRQDEAGLLYLHARFALPGVGRFLSPDPTIPSQRPIGMNPYAFAQNDPANRTDIDGLGFWEDAGAWVTNAADDVAKVARKANFRDSVDAVHDFLGLPHIDPLLDRYLGRGWNIGIGNTLALIPESIAFAGRGDWPAFAKSTALQVWVSSEIALSFIADGTPYEAAVSWAMDAASPFVMTLITTGNINAALHASLDDVPKNVLMGGKDASLKNSTFDEAMGTIGNVVGPLHDADDYAATVVSHDHAVGVAPMTRMATSSGTLFGFGYTRDQHMPLPPAAQ